ncbi:hypothetical protein ACQ4LE_000734 [Meloidogyne hapla]|uniref:Extensin-like n=1 Tax=Meloidogyne hapla TaxID=6305 RepID=A0A1I8BVL5_MELHA
MLPRRSRSKTPGIAKEGLYVQTFKPLPPMNSKQRINMLKNKTTVNAFHSSQDAGVAGKEINTPPPTHANQSSTPQTSRPAVVQHSNNGGRQHQPRDPRRHDPRLQHQPENNRTPVRSVPKPQASQTAPNLNSSKNTGRTRKFEPSPSPPPKRQQRLSPTPVRPSPSPPPKRQYREEQQRPPPTPRQATVVRQRVMPPSPPPQRQQEQRLPPTPRNVVRSQDVHHHRSSTPQVVQNNDGNLSNFFQTISEQNDFIREIENHYRVVVPEKMKLIKEVSEALTRFGEAVKTRIDEA